MSRHPRCKRLIASLMALAAALAAAAADAAPPPVDGAQTTYLQECMGQGAAANRRLLYCQCSYQQLRRRYTLQQYTLLDSWIRSGPPDLRRFAVVAWEPEFAPCRPLLQTGAPAGASQNRQPAASK